MPLCYSLLSLQIFNLNYLYKCFGIKGSEMERWIIRNNLKRENNPKKCDFYVQVSMFSAPGQLGMTLGKFGIISYGLIGQVNRIMLYASLNLKKVNFISVQYDFTQAWPILITYGTIM